MVEDTEKLKEMCLRLGADIFGTADLANLKEKGAIDGHLSKYEFGISIGIAIPLTVIKELPGLWDIYSEQYTVINRKLDQISHAVALNIEEKGYAAIPIPASRVLGGSGQRGIVSHRAIAMLAGNGWIGKSLNLVTKEYGPRVRFASILTNMKLNPGKPMETLCGNCRKCIDACIANALKEVDFKYYPESREEVLDVDRCSGLLIKNMEDPDIGNKVCGLCIKACPWGKSQQ